MNNQDFSKLELYQHNIDSYEKIVESLLNGENVVGIVHATGTGKSYNALQLALDNQDKRILYISPSNGIIEHIKKTINNNSNLDIEKDFSNLEFRTYQSFISLSKEEINDIDCDILILDEFHHIGAPIWGARVDTIIETHPDIKILGLTAYTVRDRGTSYERDMAEPDGSELFSDKIVSRYDLCDAMLDGVLPKPIYKSAYTKLMNLTIQLEDKLNKLDKTTKEYQENMAILADTKRRIHEAPSIPDILRKSLKPNGKYIYFCPPLSEKGANDIETIKKQAYEWFKEFIPEEDIVFYTSTSEMGVRGELNRNAFYQDITIDGKNASDKFRVMFAINQYNEGIHAPNVDGVIMGRGTTSDIVYFEQLGRALAVRGNTKEMFEEFSNYTFGELTLLCKSKGIPVKEKDTKEDLIQKLIAPVVIDLTNNYEFIKELENNLKNRIKEKETEIKNGTREIKLKNASFDIEIENIDIYKTLQTVMDRLTMTWQDYYEYAQIYYNHYGNLEVPQYFRTSDGYTREDAGFIRLGQWIHNQRQSTNPKSERGKLLSSIGMRFEKKNSLLPWNEMYKYAQIYYSHYGNLEVPSLFRTNDGYTQDDDGIIRLGQWIRGQRRLTNPESEKGKLLSSIGMRFEVRKRYALFWNEMYKYAQIYYNHHGNLEVPIRFKTNDGYTQDDYGIICLGRWIYEQRRCVTQESKRGKLLRSIGMRFENKRNVLPWEEMYKYAQIYYNHYGNLEIMQRFKTNDGYTQDDDGIIHLGQWIQNQRRFINPESERGKLLSSIGMCFEIKKKKILPWEKMYKYAQIYYNHYGNLEVTMRFKTNDGYTQDDDGTIRLGHWISHQRQSTNPESERGKLLRSIGMRFENKRNFLPWEKMYKYAQIYYHHYGDLKIPYPFKTNDGYTRDDDGIIRLGQWISNQRQNTNPESERGKLLSQIGMIWNVKENQQQIISICLDNDINYDINKTILNRISIQELQSKIEFLKGKNMPLVDSNGLLIDIFSMSSPNMKVKYGITLEELITEYYIEKNTSKRT